MSQQLSYKAWKDKGDTIGIECLECHRTHWDEDQPATNPLTKQPCDNCSLIKSTNVFKSENDLHKKEESAEDCNHESSQP